MAQDSMLVAGGQEEVNILYRNEASGGLVVHSNGFGVTFKRGWHLTGYKKHLLDIELVSMRHPKQYKQANIFYADAKPFFYGKLNFAYFLRGGYGRQNVLYSKGERSGVEALAGTQKGRAGRCGGRRLPRADCFRESFGGED